MTAIINMLQYLLRMKDVVEYFFYLFTYFEMHIVCSTKKQSMNKKCFFFFLRPIIVKLNITEHGTSEVDGPKCK